MTVKVSKPAINVREELADLKKPTGIAGQAMLAAETPQEQFNLIGAGRRNLIINGAMQVAQRGGSATSVSANNNTYVLDRFFGRIHGSSGAATVEQTTDSPDIFSNSLKLTVTTADTSLGSSHYHRVHQEIEGYNIVGLGWGTSSAKPITLSFWVKSSVTGVYSFGIYNGAADRSFVQEYTINAANVWEQKVITVIGPTDGVWAIDNSGELRVSFSLGMGSTYDTNGLGYWQNSFSFGSTNNVNLMATSGATWQITGVQLELGKVATPFEHRSYGEELAACQRYYQVLSNNAADIIGTTHKWNSSNVFVFCDLPVEMRTQPSLDTNISTASSALRISSSGYNVTGNNLTLDGDSSPRKLRLNTTMNNSNFPSGSSGWLRVNTSGIYVNVDAEL